MVRNNTTGGVLMSKNNLQSVFILILAGMLSVPCFLAEDRKTYKALTGNELGE